MVPGRSARTAILSPAIFAIASRLSRGFPIAAQISPTTPLFDGSGPVSRTRNRLCVPHDCIGPHRRKKNVLIVASS
jgi:hypothetical protein